MGGTSADFSAIVDNAPLWTDEGEIDGLPVRIPTLDITTIGAGGGSIAWMDKGGALRVGPQSASSEPGPACYDRGGSMPTVTDANLLSGLLHPESFSGTGITLNPDRAGQAFRSLALSADLNMEEAVLGTRSVVNANMLRGIRRATVEKGIDMRDCTLLAFGGAGPLHAAELAKELSIREVLVPPMAGMFSALGILLSAVRLDFGETVFTEWHTGTGQVVDRILDRFKERALQSFQRQGLNIKETVFRPFLDLRYKGQSFHLTIPYDKGADMAERFYQAFGKRYGYTLENGPAVEVVTVRLSAIMPREEISLPGVKNMTPGLPVAKRTILLSSGPAPAPVYQRKSLWRSFSAEGPVVIEDEGCTVFVPPECEVSVEENGCLNLIVG
jgi:N-methylhydantoinase A